MAPLWIPLLLAGASLAGAPGGDTEPARLTVRDGRVDLVGLDGVTERTPSDGPATLAAEGRLELEAGATAELAWPNSAALVLSGPGGFEWGRGIAAGLEDWRLDELAAADLEVRAGPLSLTPVEGWRIELHRGAWRIDRRPGGAVRLRQLAGEPATLRWIGTPVRVVPAREVHAGETVRLDGPPEVPDRIEAEAGRAWPRLRWPFGRPSPAMLALFERATRPAWPRVEWPWSLRAEHRRPWPAVSWPWGGRQRLVPDGRQEPQPASSSSSSGA